MGPSGTEVQGCSGGSAGTYQLPGCPVQRAEWVVQETEAGGCVEVGVAHQLAGEECLAEATPEQAARHTVAQVQLPADSLAEGQLTDSRSHSHPRPGPASPTSKPVFQGQAQLCPPGKQSPKDIEALAHHREGAAMALSQPGLWEVGQLSLLGPRPHSLLSCLALESNQPALHSASLTFW